VHDEEEGRRARMDAERSSFDKNDGAADERKKQGVDGISGRTRMKERRILLRTRRRRKVSERD